MVATRHESAEIVQVSTLLPWTCHELIDPAFRPYPRAYSMNPSIHFDGETWRCVLRCADYGMPNGVTVRPPGVTGAHQTKNAMVIFDPNGWKPISIHRMEEHHDHPPHQSAQVKGFEDMRLFSTDRGGLQGIAASLHLERPKHVKNCPPEQVLVSFDANYYIVDAKPIRGPWSSTAQKNWVPFDGAEEPLFLYNIERGSIYNELGPVEGLPKVGLDHLGEKNRFGTEIQLRRTTQPMMAGRTLPPRYRGLRGGSQLVHIGGSEQSTDARDDRWLGVAHDMCLIRDNKKYYWHVWYMVDGNGQLLAKSPPMKLAAEGIEFVAGMAIAGDRVVVSYGVDDMWCRLGETSLSAVRDLLEDVVEEEPATPSAVTARPIEVAADKLTKRVEPPVRSRNTSAPVPSRSESRNALANEVRSGPQVKMRPIPKAIDPDPIGRARPHPAETRSRRVDRLADGQRVPTAILSQGVAHVPLTTPQTLHATPGVIGAVPSPNATAVSRMPSAEAPIKTVSSAALSAPVALSPEDLQRIEDESKRLAHAFQLRTASMEVMTPAQPGALLSGTTTSPHLQQPGALMAGTSAPTIPAELVLQRALEFASAARKHEAPNTLIHLKAQLMHAINAFADLHLDLKGNRK